MPLKLASLLMEYLLANQKLDLPGIGTFKKDGSDEVSFENDPAIKDVSELIHFLSSRTGKMKALVAADLNSHLMLAQEFLNIGKPFLFEGIGSLSKMQWGGYAFVPENQKDQGSKEINKTSGTERSFTDYENVFSPPKEKSGWKKPVVVLLLLGGFGVAIWLGYLAYKKRSSPIDLAINETPARVLHSDTLLVHNENEVRQSNDTDGDQYKFVLEIANEKRAFDRFDKLKNYGWDIKMETKDSLRYKLYLLLQLPLADTSRALDSLTALNGKKVYIEN